MGTELLVALGSVVVAVIGAVSGVLALLANRRKVSSEAHENDATAAEIITKAAGEAVSLHIKAAEAACKELIRQAVAESETRCRQEMAEQEKRHQKQMADQESRYAKEIGNLREWGAQLEAKSCQRIDQLEQALKDERELRQHRDDELKEIAESLP